MWALLRYTAKHCPVAQIGGPWLRLARVLERRGFIIVCAAVSAVATACGWRPPAPKRWRWAVATRRGTRTPPFVQSISDINTHEPQSRWSRQACTTVARPKRQSGWKTARHAAALSQGFIRDFALVWAEEGLEAVCKVAKKSPEAFVAIAARICRNDVRLTLEQANPAGMSLEDDSLMREVIAGCGGYVGGQSVETYQGKSVSSVSNQPGAMALQVIPCSPSSAARERVRPFVTDSVEKVGVSRSSRSG
jgi:hypothetical protein